jgi:hypothetical protein
MNMSYTVGRSASADIQIPKRHDTVGKLHCKIEDIGEGWLTVTDLKSTNGTFLRVAGKWEELVGARTVSIDAELMLGSYVTTARRLVEDSTTAPLKFGPQSKARHEPKPLPKPARASAEKPPPKEPPHVPPKRSSGMRRNEFGEIVPE